MFDEFDIGEFDIDSFMKDAENEEVQDISTSIVSNRQIVFAIDASNSMYGYKIGAVNDSVNNIIAKLKSLSHGQGKSVDISVIGYSTRLFRWTNGFVPSNEFKYSYVEMVDGLSDINALFLELVDLAEKHMDIEAKKFVILFSDGLPTEDYTENFERWRHVEQYKDIIKIVVAFDDDLADTQSIEFFKSFADDGLIIRINEQENLLSAILSE